MVIRVAPHAGAWIETCLEQGRGKGYVLSHPTRVRGLKLMLLCALKTLSRSHPTRVRGLKHVAPQALIRCLTGRTPRGCVD